MKYIINYFVLITLFFVNANCKTNNILNNQNIADSYIRIITCKYFPEYEIDNTSTKLISNTWHFELYNSCKRIAIDLSKDNARIIKIQHFSKNDNWLIEFGNQKGAVLKLKKHINSNSLVNDTSLAKKIALLLFSYKYSDKLSEFSSYKITDKGDTWLIIGKTEKPRAGGAPIIEIQKFDCLIRKIDYGK